MSDDPKPIQPSTPKPVESPPSSRRLRSFKEISSPKAGLVVFALVFAVIGAYLLLRSFAANPPITELGFDSEAFSCGGQRLQIDKTFSLSYGACHDQIAQEVQFLAAHNVRLIRIWPVVSQFFVHEPRGTGDISYDVFDPKRLAPLDEFLAQLKQKNMKAIITLNTSGLTTCQGDDQVNFSWKILVNPTKHSQYLAGLTAFMAHYKNNGVIKSYDLMNEVNLVVGALLRDSWDKCDLPSTDINTRQKLLLALFQEIYAQAKQVDNKHPLTYSFATNASANINNGINLPALYGSMQDYYDIHSYVLEPNCDTIPKCAAAPKTEGNNTKDPKDWYDKTFAALQFPPINKPSFITGETGINEDVGSYDMDGNPCSLPIMKNLQPMNDFCQQAYLDTAAQFIAKANARGIGLIFFHGAWAHNTYIYVNYDSQGKPTGFSVTKAAQRIFNYNKAFYDTNPSKL